MRTLRVPPPWTIPRRKPEADHRLPLYIPPPPPLAPEEPDEERERDEEGEYGHVVFFN